VYGSTYLQNCSAETASLPYIVDKGMHTSITVKLQYKVAHPNVGSLCSVINVKEVADKSGQADFAETMEMENGNGNTETGNTESTAHACSQVPLCIDLTCDAAIGHVFFEVYLSCFCSCSVWYVAVPRSRR